jgi:hypothetical protein
MTSTDRDHSQSPPSQLAASPSNRATGITWAVAGNRSVKDSRPARPHEFRLVSGINCDGVGSTPPDAIDRRKTDHDGLRALARASGCRRVRARRFRQSEHQDAAGRSVSPISAQSRYRLIDPESAHPLSPLGERTTAPPSGDEVMKAIIHARKPEGRRSRQNYIAAQMAAASGIRQ